MTYATNSLITAADFNAFRNRVNTLVNAGAGDFGYGQSLNLPSVTVGQVIGHTEWQALWDAYRLAHFHQTGTEPDEPTRARFNQNALVTAHSVNSTGPGDLPGQLATLETNRFDVAYFYMGYYHDLAERFTPWNGSITATIRFTWANADHARWFFNAGGALHAALDHQTFGTDHDRSWRQALLDGDETGHNSVILTAHQVERTHPSVGDLTWGYHDLAVGSSQIGYSANSGGVYASNYHEIRIYNGGHYVDFIATLQDNYSNPDNDTVSAGTIMHSAYVVATTGGMTTYPPTVTCPDNF